MIDDNTSLKSTLEECLSQYYSTPCRILRLNARPFPRQSSFALTELDVTLDNGGELEILWKDTGKTGSLGQAAEVRLCNPENLICELRTYSELLRPSLGPPSCYGTKVDDADGRYWLFLERVKGQPLNEVGDIEIWKLAARWLAGFHEQYSTEAAELGWVARYDLGYYRGWAERALRAVLRADAQIDRRELQCIERLVGDYDKVATQLMCQFQRLIHGEFYPANIVVVPQDVGGVRICPVDWGTTAIGPALMDLAALVSGCWKENERAEIVEGYREGARSSLRMAELVPQMDLCRIHIALQWIGWCPNWRPPPDQAHDWLAEACGLAEQLGLA